MVPDFSSVFYEILFMASSGIFGTMTQILINISFKYEETFKVSIVFSTSVLFAFLFQYLILKTTANLFSTVGGMLIFFATLFLILLQILEKQFFNEKLGQNLAISKQNLIPWWKRCLFFKI